MHSFRALALLLALLPSAALPAAESLAIATYNVRNYTAADRLTADGYRPNYPKPEVEKAALRKAIHASGADVLILQEMGSLPYLEELRRDLRAEGLEYPHAAVLDGPDPARQVALLSRRAPRHIELHRRVDFAYLGARESIKRGILEVRFETPAGELTLFGVHLKSRLTERPEDPESDLRRAAEATALRDLVLRRFPDTTASRFIILGDFNDNRTGAASRRIIARGETAISDLLPAADSRGETWTYHQAAEDAYTRVDHIFVSLGIKKFVEGGRARIVDIPETMTASDHRPVVVRLVWSK